MPDVSEARNLYRLTLFWAPNLIASLASLTLRELDLQLSMLRSPGCFYGSISVFSILFYFPLSRLLYLKDLATKILHSAPTPEQIYEAPLLKLQEKPHLLSSQAGTEQSLENRWKSMGKFKSQASIVSQRGELLRKQMQTSRENSRDIRLGSS